MKKTLPKELIDLARRHGFAGQQIYIPREQETPVFQAKVLVILDEMEGFYETRGWSFYRGKEAERTWRTQFLYSVVSARHAISTRTASRVTAEARRQWKRWYRGTELKNLQRLSNMAIAYGVDESLLLVLYRQRLAKTRKGLAIETTFDGPVLHVSAYDELDECVRESLARRPWRNSEVLESMEE